MQLRIVHRLHLLTGAALLGLVLLGGIEISARIHQLREDRQNLLGVVLDNAVSVISHYEEEARAGHLTTAKAQDAAITALRAFRYRGAEYLWINDLQGRMVMHPFRPDLEGNTTKDVLDPSGFAPFMEAGRIAATGQRGFMAYRWPRPGAQKGAEAVDKISAVAPFTPWGWAIGTGLYVDDVIAASHELMWQGVWLVLAASLLMAVAAWWIGRSINRPLAVMLQDIQLMGSGNLSQDVRSQKRGDEIGALARGLEAFRLSGLEKRRMEEAAQAQDRRARRIQESMEHHTQDFGASVSGVLTALHTNAQEMGGVAGTMIAAAQRTQNGATATASGAGRAAGDLATIAAATEELSASIAEISSQISAAADAASRAVEDARTTDGKVIGLSAAVEQIDEVVRLIAGIAAQTNLLALNATIEAARAGEAGKGFAVVASEVKALAAQTANATSQISAQVHAIQAATSDAVAGIANVCTAIGEVSTVAASVAAAVEQQGAATSGIARSVQEVVQVIDLTSTEMQSVTEASTGTTEASAQVDRVAREIGAVCADLDQEVRQFLAAMRADMGSRRMYERLPAKGHRATLQSRTTPNLTVDIKDISMGGAAFETDLQLAPGSEINVIFADQDKPCPARVARCEPGLLAVAFRQTDESRLVLKGFITRLASADTTPTTLARAA